jgi:hypothetical protein
MSKTFKPISYEKLRVGKLIKSSKKRFCWVFELETYHYTIDLFSSRISGKRTILVNGNKVVSTKTSGLGTTYQVNIPKHKVLIYELGDTCFELRVDNVLFKVPTGFTGLEVPLDQRSRNMSSGNLNYEKDNFGFKEHEAQPKKIRPVSPKPVNSPNKFQISVEKTKTPEKVKIKEKVNVLDLFDMPLPANNELPVDLFSAPLTGNDFNPFEEKKEEGRKEVKEEVPSFQTVKKDDIFNLVDLDGLHLGDNYSPAFAKKLEDANKPVSINNPNVKNVPLNNLVAQREPQLNQPQQFMPGMQGIQGVQPMMMNPMMMNPFMTGMMMNPMMMNPYFQNPPK